MASAWGRKAVALLAPYPFASFICACVLKLDETRANSVGAKNPDCGLLSIEEAAWKDSQGSPAGSGK